MCFGSFEGRNFIEMEHDPDYLAWVEANCESRLPRRRATRPIFPTASARLSATLVDEALAAGEERLVILAHGGTQMAAHGAVRPARIRTIISGAAPTRAATCWMPRQLAGSSRSCTVVKTVQYTKSGRRRAMMMVWARAGRLFAGRLLWATRRGCPTRWCCMGQGASPRLEALSAPPPAQNAPGRECWAGAIVAVVLPLGTLGLSTGAVCLLAARLHPLLGLARADVLVRAGAGGAGPCAGEHATFIES